MRRIYVAGEEFKLNDIEIYYLMYLAGDEKNVIQYDAELHESLISKVSISGMKTPLAKNIEGVVELTKVGKAVSDVLFQDAAST